MKHPMLAAGVFAAIVLEGGLCAAQPAPAPPVTDPRIACRGDIARLCGSIMPGQGRIIACMRAHETQISNPCKAAMWSAQAARHSGQGPGGPPPQAPAGDPNSNQPPPPG